ncbi:hypothetical protein NL676_029087 [Syzygium grande]|nr:hypothetical protein NL676_029087 [Syzygium grande]
MKIENLLLPLQMSISKPSQRTCSSCRTVEPVSLFQWQVPVRARSMMYWINHHSNYPSRSDLGSHEIPLL